MSDNQSAPPPKPDNLIVHVAKLLQEDISVGMGSSVQLRQPPINDDDHDSWASNDGSIENWYYIAYSIIEDIDREKAITALKELKDEESK